MDDDRRRITRDDAADLFRRLEGKRRAVSSLFLIPTAIIRSSLTAARRNIRTTCRGNSSVLGVLLMVMITLLFASVVSVEMVTFASEADVDWEPSDYRTLSANPWSGSQGDLIRISNTEAGATDVTYRVNFTIKPGSSAVGNSLDHVYLEVTTGSPDMFSNTELADLEMAGIDEGSNGTIEQKITDDVEGWQVKKNGTALQIDTNTDYSGSANDSIIVIFDGVDNPKSAGEYELRAETSDDGNWHNGTITIVD